MKLPEQIKSIIMQIDHIALKALGQQYKQASVMLENWWNNPTMVEDEPVKEEETEEVIEGGEE